MYEDYDLGGTAPGVRWPRRRPLTKEEHEQAAEVPGLHAHGVRHALTILDGERHECPKLDEIERLLPDLLERSAAQDPDFLRVGADAGAGARMCAVTAGVEFAWHTGSVPQPQRRAEIRRFRADPECRLFLSSESGGVGLNLQVADTVVNMDLPWNPARLEQRIARAWRKHQTRPVTVINLVSEYTIEHRMLGLLDAKRTLAEGVLDQRGDLSEIPLPTGRAAFMERLNAVLGARADAAGGCRGRRCGRRCSPGAKRRRAASRRPGGGARRDAAPSLRARRRRGGAGGARPAARAYRQGRTPPRRIHGAERQR